MRCAVVGASGYAGTELLRLLAGHPHAEVVVATGGAHAGTLVGEHTPALAAAYPDLRYQPVDPEQLRGLDVVFLALPHGHSQSLVPEIVGQCATVVDLAADFRLRDAQAYPEWYGHDHGAPELLGIAVTGLPELHRAELAGARLVAVPGCYPTAAALALAPLERRGLLGSGTIVIDAASGVSGAGRAPSDALHFGTVHGDFRAYGLLRHRHTPEMEQAIGRQVLFTPHLAPMARGILATCYAPAAQHAVDDAAVGEALDDFCADEPFLVHAPAPPGTKDTAGSNCAHLHARVDPRSATVVVLAAIDNLVKGAAGQAVQCANLATGLEETAGLATAGMVP